MRVREAHPIVRPPFLKTFGHAAVDIAAEATAFDSGYSL
jgi:hypothetical protein